MHYDLTKYLVHTIDTGNPRVEGIILNHRRQERLRTLQKVEFRRQVLVSDSKG